MALALEAVDVRDATRWRWLLTDEATGKPLADHQVRLDRASDPVMAFDDLYGYAWSYAAPDRRVTDEARIAARLGDWAGRVLLGEPVGAAIAAAAPVTVRVRVPAEAGYLALWPLELAHAGGRPLAARGDVTLVYDIAAGPARAKAEAVGPTRMLAVFSQPTETSVLALHRERHELSRLIRRIAATQRRMVELRVVQYGVTRERLAEIADDGDGWDVLHLSGHGDRGLLLLEHADGSPDPVGVTDLIELLSPSARARVKLAVVSACQSAAATTAQTLRLLGLTEQAEQVEEAGTGEAAGQAAGVAQALVAALDCAVVAMRYPVSDEFAIAFAGEFYERLLGRRQSADVAVTQAVKAACGPVPTAAVPALSLVTPGVFGTRAVGLRVEAPRGAPRFDPDETPTAYFPPEPQRFVGRAAAMALASTALAPDSGRTTVLLHGMAGAGKTACALELAYGLQDSFAAAAFWTGPTQDDAWDGALASLATALEIQLGRYGFAMTGHIGTIAALEAFLPRLRHIFHNDGLLLVLDNLETLLTPEGTWRDPRWEPLIGALTSHDGESRLIMTSRIAPAGLGPRTLVLPMHSLSLAEAVALARELPNLRALLHADSAPVRDAGKAEAGKAEAGVAADRDRVRRVLHVVQGHPKLMELAAAAAVDPRRLDQQLGASAVGQDLEAFFRDGISSLDGGQFLAALTAWTTGALDVLSPEARLMAQFVACLEDTDRETGIIQANWDDLWHRLERPGDPPVPGPLLATLATAALIEVDARPDEPPSAIYRMHPGVAAAIMAAADGVREAVDTELGAYWRAVSTQARDREGGEYSELVVSAGLAATPYLLRRHDWDAACTLLERAVIRDRSPEAAQAIVPLLRRIAAVTGAPYETSVLAKALRYVDPAEAEAVARASLAAAARTGDDRLASVIATDLVTVLRDAGRLAEALQVAGQMAGHTRRAGLGPWTQLLDQAQRLQILSYMGEHETVLAETKELRRRMDELSAAQPDPAAGEELVSPWQVREIILDTGHTSALVLGRWQDCLDLTAEIAASKQRRGAGAHERGRTRFNDAVPLIRLGRLEEAGRLLSECQQVFEDQHDIRMLSKVLSTRADLEDELGHEQAAIGLERIAIRFSYAQPDPKDIATSHHNLAYYLRREGGDLAGERAHWLAAALIRRLTGMTHDLAGTVRALAGLDLSVALDEVIEVAEQTDGVRLSDLLTALEPDRQVIEGALAEIIRDAAS